MPLKKKKLVLFIDDEPMWLEAIRLSLKDQTLNIITADGGEAALETLEKKTPDLIMSDVRMPIMNGFDLFLRVRNAGYKLIYEPRHTLLHIHSASIKKQKRKTPKQVSLTYEKNRLRYIYKHYPIYFVPAIASSLIKQIVDRRDGKDLTINFNPFSLIDLFKQISLKKEKIHLSEREVMNRINKIYETRG